jgi:hypothetical protein
MRKWLVGIAALVVSVAAFVARLAYSSPLASFYRLLVAQLNLVLHDAVRAAIDANYYDPSSLRSRASCS